MLFFQNEALREKAAVKFAETLRDRLNWISRHCYTSVLDLKFKELNEIFEAARKFEVTSAVSFTEGEISQLVVELAALKNLQMTDEARDHLIGALTAKGVDPRIFEACVAKKIS